MKKVGNLKLYSFEELLEEDYGKAGTPERDAFEQSVDEAVQAYRVGEAIKQAREAQKLTQAELGEKMGVQRAQVCRLESGKSITLSSMMRAFRALGVQVALEMKGIGKVALWSLLGCRRQPQPLQRHERHVEPRQAERAVHRPDHRRQRRHEQLQRRRHAVGQRPDHRHL